MRSGHDLIRSPKLSPADAIELAIFFASTPITHFLTVLDPQTLAGAEGFEPPSSVLETDSLTVELTPLKSIGNLRFVIGDLKTPVAGGFSITNYQLQIISLLCAACACGTGCRTSSVPDGPVSSCGSWSSNSSALCNHHTAT